VDDDITNILIVFQFHLLTLQFFSIPYVINMEGRYGNIKNCISQSPD